MKEEWIWSGLVDPMEVGKLHPNYWIRNSLNDFGIEQLIEEFKINRPVHVIVEGELLNFHTQPYGEYDETFDFTSCEMIDVPEEYLDYVSN